MLKAEHLLLHCIPLEIIDDPEIEIVKKEALCRLEELRRWNKEGRPFSENHANLNDFPKFTLAIQKIRKLKGVKRVLDVGCYTGDFLQHLADEGMECVGVDIHRFLIDKLNIENKKPKLKFLFGQAENVDKIVKGKFDLVTAFDVLEHCFDFDKAVKAIEAVTKKDGWVFINLPRMTIGYKDEAYEHLRMFSEKQLNEYFRDRKDYKMETCQDEHGRDTSFITYRNA